MSYRQNDQTPLVSVVVPAYKHAAFIKTALQSISDQTYSKLELIVVDDCSPDSTLSAAADWASDPEVRRRFLQIRLLRNERNLGAHASINRGIGESSGSHIAILNSDDAYHASRIIEIVSAMQASGASLGFSKVAPIDDLGRYIGPREVPPQLYGAFEEVDRVAANLPTIGLGFRHQNIAISTGNLVFTRRLFEQVGPFAPLLYVHDWDFSLRSTLFTEPAYVPKYLYFYRIHRSNSFSELSQVAASETEIVQRRFKACQLAIESSNVTSAI